MVGSLGLACPIGVAGANESMTPFVSEQAVDMDKRKAIRMGAKWRLVFMFYLPS